MENLIYEMIEATEHLDGYVRLTDTNGCIFCIPLDPANSDYQAYLKSLEEQANDQSL
jgi:hypothetical protein